MKVYSPSQTKSFLTCPVMWQLNKEGWVTRTYGKPSVYAVRGTAVAKGLDDFNKGLSLQACLSSTQKAAEDEYDRMRLGEREWSDVRAPEPTLALIVEQARSLVQSYMANVPTGFEVVEAECKFPDHGYCRPDVVAFRNGALFPLDYKVKDVPNTPFIRHKIITDYEHDWSMLHYCWAIQKEFGQPCSEYVIAILWYGKSNSTELFTFNVRPQRLDAWEQSAFRVWEEMERIETGQAPAYETASHRTVFGACDFKRACLELDRDRGLMGQEYLMRGRYA